MVKGDFVPGQQGFCRTIVVREVALLLIEISYLCPRFDPILSTSFVSTYVCLKCE